MTPILLILGLMILGLVLLAVEFFLIPGVGVAGLLGAVGVLGSGYLAVTELSSTAAALVIGGSFVGAAASFWLLPKTKLGKGMVLEAAITGTAPDEKLKDLLHREGTALTVLRPSGSIDIDDCPVDAVTDGQYVEAGTRVRVVRVEGVRVVVEPIAQA